MIPKALVFDFECSAEYKLTKGDKTIFIPINIEIQAKNKKLMKYLNSDVKSWKKCKFKNPFKISTLTAYDLLNVLMHIMR